MASPAKTILARLSGQYYSPVTLTEVVAETYTAVFQSLDSIQGIDGETAGRIAQHAANAVESELQAIAGDIELP